MVFGETEQVERRFCVLLTVAGRLPEVEQESKRQSGRTCCVATNHGQREAVELMC